MPNQFVFVYGTLRKGGRLHEYLESAPLIAEYRMPGYDLYAGASGWFPVARKGTGTLVGEIYEASAHVMHTLDMVEGHPRFFERHLVDVLPMMVPTTGHVVEEVKQVWIYTGETVPVGEKIPDGDWLGVASAK